MQFALRAILALRRVKALNKSKLTEDVNEWLSHDPDFCASGYDEIDRRTMRRALDELRAALR